METTAEKKAPINDILMLISGEVQWTGSVQEDFSYGFISEAQCIWPSEVQLTQFPYTQHNSQASDTNFVSLKERYTQKKEKYPNKTLKDTEKTCKLPTDRPPSPEHTLNRSPVHYVTLSHKLTPMAI